MMHSSVFTVYAVPMTDDDISIPVEGYVVVGVLPIGLDPGYTQVRYVLHGAPGVSAPPAAVQTIVDGNVTPWAPAAIAAAWPQGAPYVLETEYTLNGEFGRCKKIDVPVGATVIEDNIIPHLWAGEVP